MSKVRPSSSWQTPEPALDISLYSKVQFSGLPFEDRRSIVPLPLPDTATRPVDGAALNVLMTPAPPPEAKTHWPS